MNGQLMMSVSTTTNLVKNDVFRLVPIDHVLTTLVAVLVAVLVIVIVAVIAVVPARCSPSHLT